MNDKIRLVRTGRGFNRCYINGSEIFHYASQEIKNHSPNGFEWGYGGSGPSQLALAIVYHITGNRTTSLSLYHRFKEQFIMKVKANESIIDVDVSGWVKIKLEEDDARI